MMINSSNFSNNSANIRFKSSKIDEYIYDAGKQLGELRTVGSFTKTDEKVGQVGTGAAALSGAALALRRSFKGIKDGLPKDVGQFPNSNQAAQNLIKRICSGVNNPKLADGLHNALKKSKDVVLFSGKVGGAVILGVNGVLVFLQGFKGAKG